MANSILGAIFGKASFSLMDIASFEQVATSLKVVKVNIKWRSSVMRHMREDGSTVVDARVIRPAEINVYVICPDANSLVAANDLMNNRGTMYQLSTKGLIIPNIVIDEEQLTQAPENLSSTPMQIKFKQILVGGFESIIFSQTSDASLVDRGLALLDDVEQKATDLYTKVSDKVSGLL